MHDLAHALVGEAGDGDQAIALCRSGQPDIAFIDIDMPGMNAHEAAAKIRADLPAIDLIMISALPTVANVQQAMASGARFVVKPFNAAKVKLAINACLDRRL